MVKIQLLQSGPIVTCDFSILTSSERGIYYGITTFILGNYKPYSMTFNVGVKARNDQKWS